MPSHAQSAFTRGSTSLFVDRDELLSQLQRVVRQAARRHGYFSRVYLFGSMARGESGPRSDADLLVVLTGSDKTRQMDRIPEILEALGPTPVAVDVVPWTERELREAEANDHPWLQRIKREWVAIPL